MSDALTYAKALGPPDDWDNLRIVRANGAEEKDVIEANAAESWLIRYKRDVLGNLIIRGGDLVTERVECAFSIERKA